MDTLAPKTRGCQFSTEAEHLKYYSRWFCLIDAKVILTKMILIKLILAKHMLTRYSRSTCRMECGIEKTSSCLPWFVCTLIQEHLREKEIFKKYIKGTWPDCQTQGRYAGGDTEVFKRNQRLIISPPCKARGRFLASWRSWGISRDPTAIASPIVSSQSSSTPIASQTSCKISLY